MKYSIFFMVVLFSTGCSGFHVKVIDQYGKPVPDVKVRVGVLTNLFLVSGSKTKFYKTDDDGRFVLGGPRVGIELIEKNGYEFSDEKGIGSINIYSHYDPGPFKQQDNSYSNPYYILAWKREKPERLIGKQSTKGVALTPDGKFYGIYFSNEGLRQKIIDNFKSVSKTNSLLLVRYKESNEVVLNRQNIKKYPWELTIFVPNGGLIKTDDIIRNLAPKDGYQKEWKISSNELKNVDSTVTQRFYISSRNGEIYGHFTLKFRPKFRSLRFTPYWINFNASRNLTRPKEYIYCKPREFVAEDCSIDNFGP